MTDLERKRFEELYDSGKIYNAARDIKVQFQDYTKQMAWAAWQARCPEGYSVVPNEPTEAMTAKMCLGSATDAPNKEPIEFWKRAWVRTLAAAPQPGEE